MPRGTNDKTSTSSDSQNPQPNLLTRKPSKELFNRMLKARLPLPIVQEPDPLPSNDPAEK
jgi:hypothetical protein